MYRFAHQMGLLGLWYYVDTEISWLDSNHPNHRHHQKIPTLNHPNDTFYFHHWYQSKYLQRPYRLLVHLAVRMSYSLNWRLRSHSVSQSYSAHLSLALLAPTQMQSPPFYLSNHQIIRSTQYTSVWLDCKE